MEVSMNRNHQGGSLIGLLATLAIVAYGVYLAFQYVPQRIEAATVQTVLDNVVDMHLTHRMDSVDAAWGAIDKQLYISGRDDLKGSFKVEPGEYGPVVTVGYERELDLLFTKLQIPYEKSVILH